MDIKERDKQLNEMVLEGKPLEAFDRFYAEDVVMQEGADDPIRGKDVNRKREEDFFAGVTEVRKFELKDVTVGENVTMSIWDMDFTHEEWGDVAYEQVAVREWNDDGLIERERFFKAA